MCKEDRIKELIALYSLELLEADELHEVEEALRSKDEKYLKYFEDVNTVYSNLAYGLEDKPLRPGLKAEILAEVLSSPKPATEEKKRSLADFFNIFWFKFATAAVCLVVGVLLYSNMEIRKELNAKSEKLILLDHELFHQTNFNTVFDGSNVKEVSLVNLDSAIKMKLYLNSIKDKAVLCIVDIPSIGEDKTYQLWVESKDDMQSIATFATLDNDNRFPMHVMIDKVPSSSTQMDLYVSVEPKGGMPKPTGEKFLLGKL